MASFVGYARKHNPNPKTLTQNRESNHGGKLADDHFQRLFIGGVIKRAQVTTDITPAVIEPDGTITFGVGIARVYTVTSDTVDGPPYAIFEDGVTVYNERVATFAATEIITVLDTGRFLVAQGHYAA